MANDNKASYTRIGFTVVIAVVATLGTLIYLGGMRGRGSETLVETYYDKGVSGLSVGSPVNLRGVKIGAVREISFIGVKYPEVREVAAATIYIKMAVDHEKLGISKEDGDLLTAESISRMISRGLRATVASSGITGVSRIELNFYEPDKASPIVPLKWHPHELFIPPQISLLDNFSDSATKVMNQINKMDINAVWSNIASSVESLARASDAARIMMESRQGDFDKLVEDLTATTRSLKEFSSELKCNPSLLIRERQRSALPETAR